MLELGSLGGSVRYAFTTRAGGVSAAPFDALNLSLDVGDDPGAVATNRRRVLHRLGLETAVWLRAQHSGEVAVIRDAPVGAPEVDATVTAQAGLPLAALSADCALIVLADPGAGVFGVAHCGRQGLVAGVVANAVAALLDLGAAAIRSAVGPSICGACYEVPRELAEAVWRVVPASQARTHDGRFAIDVAAGVTAQLAGEGVEITRHVAGCTLEDPTLFSHRRDGVTGRMAAIAWRPV